MNPRGTSSFLIPCLLHLKTPFWDLHLTLHPCPLSCPQLFPLPPRPLPFLQLLPRPLPPPRLLLQPRPNSPLGRRRRHLLVSACGGLRTQKALPLSNPPFFPSVLSIARSSTGPYLYNWKTHNPSFSQDPQALTSLIKSILLTHQPTWDDCQQLLQVLLNTEERQQVLLEARKNVPGPGGLPTQLPNKIDEGFPLTRPDWDYETAPGWESLQIYRQALLVGLKGAGKRPTNLAKVRTITQERDESPAAFMERLLEGFQIYTPLDPEALEHKATVAMAFIDQAALNIKGKLQRLDGIQTYRLQELVKEAEKVYNKRETPEEREARLAKEQIEREDRKNRVKDKHLTKILAAVVREKGPGREGEKRRRPAGPRVFASWQPPLCWSRTLLS
uniref:Core shell protein Gag P30 domain-containing protein n=1 Tax=Macaca mulatta TaxID=9544 RepID=A0A5F7ZPF7_MACMU